MRNINTLTDDEIQQCLDTVEGIVKVETIREILNRENVVADGYIDVDAFGSWYAYGLQDYILEDENTEPWQEAYAINFAWGVGVAIALDTILQQ